MYSTARLRDNQPHTVQVITILLWIVWGQHGPWWSREVEEARNYKKRSGKKLYMFDNVSKFTKTSKHKGANGYRPYKNVFTYTHNWVCFQTTGYCVGTWWLFLPRAQKPTGKRRSRRHRAESDRHYDDQTQALRDHHNLLCWFLKHICNFQIAKIKKKFKTF